MRVNVITPQKKSKSAGFTAILLTIIMIIGCFTTACQPTPEGLIVQNKADEELKEAISVTAEPTTQQNTEEPEETIRITQSATNEAGTIAVNIDADVTLPNISKIPVAYIEPIDLNQSQVEKILYAFFGNSELYEVVATKADIEQQIIDMKRVLEDDEALLNSDMADATGITDLAELRKMQEVKIEKRKEKLQDAPNERTSLSYDVSSEEFIYASIHTNKDYMGYFTYANDSSKYVYCTAFGGERATSVRKLNTLASTQIDINNGDVEYSNAKQSAINMINDMGIEGVELGEAYLSMDYTGVFMENDTQETPGVTSDREFYVFCFERVIGDGAIDYTFYSATGTDDEYDDMLSYEKIQVWVEGDNITQFAWVSPFTVKEITNDNVAISIDYDQAVSLMYQQAYVLYGDLWNGLLKDMVVNIDKVEFALTRIKEINTCNYLVIPVWKFYGDLTGRLTDEAISKGYYGNSDDYIPIEDWYINHENPMRNIITINALDGTLIDMAKGY